MRWAHEVRACIVRNVQQAVSTQAKSAVLPLSSGQRKRKRKQCKAMIFADVVLLQLPSRPPSLANGLGLRSR